MNYFNHQNVQLAYEAVYNQDLCESMEDLGLIDDYDYLEEERKEDTVARREGRPLSTTEKINKRNRETGLSTETRETIHKKRRNPKTGHYFHELRQRILLGTSKDRHGNTIFRRPHYIRHPQAYAQDLRRYNSYLGLPENTPFSEMYDALLGYLLDEGYADTLGSAEIILENMSDEWIDEILELSLIHI
mgnify:CR=1 FL=1